MRYQKSYERHWREKYSGFYDGKYSLLRHNSPFTRSQPELNTTFHFCSYTSIAKRGTRRHFHATHNHFVKKNRGFCASFFWGGGNVAKKFRVSSFMPWTFIVPVTFSEQVWRRPCLKGSLLHLFSFGLSSDSVFFPLFSGGIFRVFRESTLGIFSWGIKLGKSTRPKIRRRGFTTRKDLSIACLRWAYVYPLLLFTRVAEWVLYHFRSSESFSNCDSVLIRKQFLRRDFCPLPMPNGIEGTGEKKPQPD